MAKVKVTSTFIGTPEEMGEYGGQTPADLKKYEKRLSDADKANYSGVITVGTEMEVSDKRAKELADLGLIEGGKYVSTPGEKVLVRDTPRETKEAPATSERAATTAAPKAAAKASAKAATKSGKKSR